MKSIIIVRLSPIDEEFINVISNYSATVPVVAKADTMTLRERNDFLHLVESKLELLEQNEHKMCYYRFSNESKYETTGKINVTATTTIAIENDLNEETDLYSEELVNSSPINSETVQIESTLMDENLYYTTNISQTTINALVHHSSMEMLKLNNIFAVICDRQKYRVYTYATLDIYNEDHSDLARLQRVIFEDG